MAAIESTWDAARRLLATRLAGAVAPDDVTLWEQSLDRALARVPDGHRFRLLSDLHGYEPTSVDAHRRMRRVVPRALAQCGFRTALIDLAGGGDVEIVSTRGIRCVAVAHVHHDAFKMAYYDSTAGSRAERFFACRVDAEAWVTSVT